MTKFLIQVALSLLFLYSYSQSWMKGGNNPSANPFTLGSNTNDPIMVETNNTQRIKLNPNINYPINGYFSTNKNGYLLLGSDGNLGSGGTLYQTKGAFSLLHLNGPGSFVQEAGYRPWIQTGVTFTSSSDLMYVGQLSRSNDQTDAVITWSDNSGSGFDLIT